MAAASVNQVEVAVGSGLPVVYESARAQLDEQERERRSLNARKGVLLLAAVGVAGLLMSTDAMVVWMRWAAAICLLLMVAALVPGLFAYRRWQPTLGFGDLARYLERDLFSLQYLAAALLSERVHANEGLLREDRVRFGVACVWLGVAVLFGLAGRIFGAGLPVGVLGAQ